jgi:tetratricopeptide (TPR) repeat protein
VREQNKAKKGRHYASAVESAEKLVALTDSADAHKHLADALLGAKQYRRAVSEYETVLAKEPKNCAAMLSKSQALVPLEKWSEVVSWGQKAASCGGKKHLAYNQMAFGYIKLQQWDDAISAADRSLSVKKTSMAERFKTTAMQKKDVEMHNAKVAQEAAELARERAEEERRIAEAKRREEEYRIKTGQAKQEEGEKKKKDDGDSDSDG